MRHTRARSREPHLFTVFGAKQKRRFLAGEKSPKFAKFQCENARKNFAFFCAYREHWLHLPLNLTIYHTLKEISLLLEINFIEGMRTSVLYGTLEFRLEIIKRCTKLCFTILLICKNRFHPFDSVYWQSCI